MCPYLNIFGFNLSTYGLCMVLGIIVSALFSTRRILQEGGHWEDILIVGACGLGIGLFCGSLLYAFVTYPIDQIAASICKGDFSVFGGIVFYGGLLGGIGGAFLGIKLSGCSFQTLEKAVVPTIPLGHAFGRIGCVMAGCCHGMPYSGIFALYYPSSVLGLPTHQGFFPVQLLESLINIALFSWLLHLASKQHRKGTLLCCYLTSYGIVRFLLEFLRGDLIRGHFLYFSVSQWISIALIIICGAILLINLIRSIKRRVAV